MRDRSRACAGSVTGVALALPCCRRGCSPRARAPAASGFPKPLLPSIDLSTRGRQGRGRAQHHRVGRATRRTASNLPEYDWVHGVPGRDRLPGQRQDRRHLGPDGRGHAHAATWDGVSASGDATLRLIAGGEVAEIDTTTIPGFSDVAPFLQDAPHYVVDGKHYGVPHGWGGNSLMYNTDDFTAAPTSWDVVFDPAKMAQLQRPGHGVRQRHLHRGRGPVPQGAPARAGHHRCLRADPAAARRGRGAAQGAASLRGPVLVARSAPRSTTSRTAPRPSARRGPTR